MQQSLELPHARSLTCGRIPELFEQRHPSANVLKVFLARMYNYEIFLQELFLWNIFNWNIFQFMVVAITVSTFKVESLENAWS